MSESKYSPSVFTAFYHPRLTEDISRICEQYSCKINRYTADIDLWADSSCIAVIDREYFGEEEWENFVTINAELDQALLIFIDGRDDLPNSEQWETYLFDMHDEAQLHQVLSLIDRSLAHYRRIQSEEETRFDSLEEINTIGRGLAPSAYVTDGIVDTERYSVQRTQILWCLDACPDTRRWKNDLRTYLTEYRVHHMHRESEDDRRWRRIHDVTLGVRKVMEMEKNITYSQFSETLASSFSHRESTFNTLALINMNKLPDKIAEPESEFMGEYFSRIVREQYLYIHPEVAFFGLKAKSLIPVLVQEEMLESEELLVIDGQTYFVHYSRNLSPILFEFVDPISESISDEVYFDTIMSKLFELFQKTT